MAALTERVKELTALHSASTLMLRDDLDPQRMVEGLAAILPPAFQYPEVTAARIRLGSAEAKSPGFVESPEALTVEFPLESGERGSIEVVYTEARPAEAIGPFLVEEQSLLRTIGDMARSAHNHRQAVAALRNSEARMRFYASSTFEGIAVHAHGIFVEVNEQFALMVGRPVREIIGTRVDEIVPAAQTESFRHHLEARNGEAFSTTLLRNSDMPMTVEVRTTAAVHGGLTAAVSVFRDMTERRLLEEQLQRTQRLESLGSLAAGIAHDLNNILAPVLLSVGVLQKRVADPASRRLVDSLGTCAHRGKQIVKQILTFARGSRDPFTVQQLRDLIGEIDSFIRHTFPKGIRIVLDTANDLRPVLGDATQLHQVLLNLCVNARDAMGNQGTLTIEATNVRLEETDVPSYAPGAGDYVRIAVRDTGSGIPAHIRERIFDPFFSTKNEQGTGLGLFTATSIVREHRGFIALNSDHGSGAEFRVFLPAAARTEIAREPPEEILPAGNGEHILIVDDEQSILQIACETLEAYGYRVSTAIDGAEALTMLGSAAAGDIALMITDANMPLMNGVETIRAVRERDPRLKVVLSTGSLNDAQRTAVHAMRIDGWLDKPYTASQLLQVLQRALAGEPASSAHTAGRT